MHIAIDASRATRARPTGTENYARQLIERVVRAHPEVRWTLFFRDDPQTWLAELPHVERVVLHAARLWTYTALAPALWKLRPDAFWEPAHVLPPTVPLRGIPSLVTVHDIGYEHFPAAHTAAQLWYLRLTTRYHAAFATHILAVSDATRDDLINFYKTDPTRISVGYLGVDHTRFHPITNRVTLEVVRHTYGTGKRFVLYVGTLQPRKNIHRLIRAFAALAPRFPDVKLVLAGGQGWLADDVTALIKETGMQERIVRTGYVADEDLPALLSAAEIFAFPSLFEGFGIPVLEAMACGTPVVTSTTSSLPEVAGDAALTVEPTSEQQIQDALALLLSQPSLRAALRERGLAQAARFTWEAGAVKVWEALSALATPTPPLPSDKIEILGLPIDNLTWDGTLAKIERMVKTGRMHQIATANPEFLMRARREPAFMEVLHRADVVLADGAGLLLAARWRGKKFADQITGSDLTSHIAALAAEKGWHVYLLGAAPGVAQKAAEKLRLAHPTLHITADSTDPTPEGPPELIATIRAARPHILLVAYGAPKQDYWIDSFGRMTGVPVQMGIGGSLDFIAGVVPRAPVAWRRVYLEWLWRLKQEPWRWRRMLALPQFAALAAVEGVKGWVTRKWR